MADEHPIDPASPLDRRRALGLAATAAAAAGSAWITPAVLSADAAGAATAPPPQGGVIFGFALQCGHEPSPGTTVTYTGPVNGSVPASDLDGSFLIGGLPPGAYTLTNGGTSSPPVNLPAGGSVGPVTINDESGGC